MKERATHATAKIRSTTLGPVTLPPSHTTASQEHFRPLLSGSTAVLAVHWHRTCSNYTSLGVTTLSAITTNCQTPVHSILPPCLLYVVALCRSSPCKLTHSLTQQANSICSQLLTSYSFRATQPVSAVLAITTPLSAVDSNTVRHASPPSWLNPQPAAAQGSRCTATFAPGNQTSVIPAIYSLM